MLRYPHMNLPEGPQFGLISQQLDTIAELKNLVQNVLQPEILDADGNLLMDSMSFKALNYTGLIPLLISGINELTTRLEEMESRLNNCCGSGIEYRNQNPEEETVHQLSVELNAVQVVVLEQNVPNPFAEQTSISYFIPEDAGNAQMQFTDYAGRVIKSVELEKGSGVVTVFAQNLGSGTYAYSLIIDGKVMETKRMMKTR